MRNAQDIPTPAEALAASSRTPKTSAEILLATCIVSLQRYTGEELFVNLFGYDGQDVSQVMTALAMKGWATRTATVRGDMPVLAIRASEAPASDLDLAVFRDYSPPGDGQDLAVGSSMRPSGIVPTHLGLKAHSCMPGGCAVGSCAIGDGQ
jgi:hypothetical protein